MKSTLFPGRVSLRWLLLLGLILFAGTYTLPAQGTAFTYQGRLMGNAKPINGCYDLTFTLFNTNGGAAPIAGPVTNCATLVSNGLFTVVIDFGPSVCGGVSNWLEIAVCTNGANSFTTLGPRQPILPVPYAIYAATAGTALTAGSANSVSATNITGPVSLTQLPGTVLTNYQSGVTLGGTFGGTFSGNGAGLTNLNFSPGSVNPNSLTIGATNVIAPLTIPPTVPASAIGSVATGWAPYCVALAGRYAYVVNYDGDSLQVIDVSTPSALAVISSVSTGAESGPKSVAVAGHYAYVAEYGDSGHALQIFDVSNPALPVSVGSVAAGSPNCVVVSGHYAYVTGDGSPVQIFDVSVPSAPVSVGSVSGGGTPVPLPPGFPPGLPVPTTGAGGGTSISVSGRYAYVVNFPTGIKQMQVIDVSNPAAPVVVGTGVTTGDPTCVTAVGRYAYVLNWPPGSASPNLQIFDVSNPAAPVSVGSVATAGASFSVAVAGRYAYVAGYGGNLQIFDVSNPAAPVDLGSVAAGSNPQSVVVSGRYAYVANYGDSTLQVFDLGGAYIQQLEAGTIEAGTLQTRDTVTVGNNLNVRGGLTVGGSVLFSGGVSANNITGGITTNILIGGHMFYYTNGVLMNVQ